MSPTRLHELPESALQRVLRHLSSKPARWNWRSFVDSEDALTALYHCSALRGVARESFKRIVVHVLDNGERELGNLDMVHLRSTNDLIRWCQAAGESLTELAFAADRHRDVARKEDESILQALEGNCHFLRRLDFIDFEILKTDMVKASLERTRGRLRQFSTPSLIPRAPAIERHCIGLRKLVLFGSYFNILEILRFAGPTLESIHYLHPMAKGNFKKIRELCPKLSSILLHAENDGFLSDYADLLCSYGEQVRCAIISCVLLKDC